MLEIVLADQTRVPLVSDLTIGRAPENTLQLDDPAVSRRQARIVVSAEDGTARVEDVGSTFGTWLDGRRLDGVPTPLRDGSRLRLGNQELVVERRREESEAGRTIVVEPGATPAGGVPPGGRFGTNPTPRSGYALKRLEASEGENRWVLRDLESDRFLRMSDADARLFELLDGRRSLSALVRESKRSQGPAGPLRLVRLLAELADRGLLAGVAAGAPPGIAGGGGALRRLSSWQKTWDGAGAFFQRLYRRGARRIFTLPGLAAIVVLAVAGLAAFPYLVVARYGTPFVVAQKIGIGALVFLVGRFAVAAVHESAHGLAMASFGRRAGVAGVKLVFGFPYVFVDTSEAWFEPRRRRIVISAAGPVADLSTGALFALTCLALPAGAGRDILFQLAFAAYLGAFFNLNPFVERDGYQILADMLGQQGLRARARAQLARRLSGSGGPDDSKLLTRYAAAGVAWSAVAASFAVGTSLRYEPRLAALAPPPVVWASMSIVWVALFVPVLVAVLVPLRARRRPR
jgi:pSer/pThr/pTyr-binding forkhead associated (FHA) protein